MIVRYTETKVLSSLGVWMSRSSGELQIARKAPEDKGVHRVVELLQDIAHDERCGQAQQMLRDAAAR